MASGRPPVVAVDCRCSAAAAAAAGSSRHRLLPCAVGFRQRRRFSGWITPGSARTSSWPELPRRAVRRKPCALWRASTDGHPWASEPAPETVAPPPPPPLVLLAAGGTGGHVYPALAVAQRLQAKLGHDGVRVEFVGTKSRMEWDLVTSAGFTIHAIPAVGLRRPLHRPSNLLLPFRLIAALAVSLATLLRLRPAVVIGTGGYVSFPTCLAAWLLRRPVVLQEQNAVPGLANWLLAHLARRICTAFPSCADHLPPSRRARVVLTGNPLRAALGSQPPAAAKEALGALPHHRVVVVVGGSLGAAAINAAVSGSARSLLQSMPDLFILWATGTQQFDEVAELVEQHPRLRVVPYLHDMGTAYSAADLVVGRAGAMTCSELVATRTPAVLVPLPSAAGDHQTANASSLQDAGAALLLTEAELSSGSLAACLKGLLADREVTQRMRHSAGKLAPANDATDRVVAEVMRLMHEEGQVTPHYE